MRGFIWFVLVMVAWPSWAADDQNAELLEQLNNRNEVLQDIKQGMTDPSAAVDVTTALDEQKTNDWQARNFKTVFQHHIEELQKLQIYQGVMQFFDVAFSGECQPLVFSVEMFDHELRAQFGAHCNLPWWPWIRAVVLFCSMFMAIRIALDN